MTLPVPTLDHVVINVLFDMDRAAAYADNWSDRSLLERVGRAAVVHPKGRLLRLARIGCDEIFAAQDRATGR